MNASLTTPLNSASMGPHSFERGNMCCPCWGKGQEPLQWGLTLSSEETGWPNAMIMTGAKLQWGLTLSSEETVNPRSHAVWRRRASMGPHSFERGNLPIHRLHQPVQHASMGPHSFERGNESGLMICSALGLASMGPHSFERGNLVSPVSYTLSIMALQWGLTLSSEETRVRSDISALSRGFNGASLFRARKHVDTLWEIDDLSASFNGASLFRARKPVAKKHRHKRGASFNGASLFRARKLLSLRLTKRAGQSLQWGLTLSSEETSWLHP